MRTNPDAAIYRPDLGIAVMEYVEGREVGFIGLEVFPLFETPDSAGTFPVIPMEVLLKLPDTSRAPRANYNTGDWKYENGLYQTAEKGWKELVDDGERKMLDRRVPGKADLVSTKRAVNIILRSQEKRIADKLFNASNFTAHAITNEWDDSANATPITDVKTGKAAFRLQCGMLPDALVINYSVFENLRNCAQIVDRIKYTFPGIQISDMNAAQLATCLGVPRVLVAGAIYDSAGAGLDASIAELWSNEYAALVKISRNRDDVTEPGVGRTFLWTEDSPTNPIVEQYRDEDKRSDAFRVRHNVDERLIQSFDSSGTVVSNVAAACCYLFSNVTT